MANNTPEVRFEGFSENWRNEKLSELATFSKGAGYTKNDLKETGNPIVLYGRLYTKYQTVINDVDTFVEEKPNSIISTGNEVVVPSSGESSEDISRASVIGKAGLILGGDLNIIKPSPTIDPTFLALTISNGTQQKEMSKLAQGKSVVHLHNSDLKRVNLLYPKLEEQTKIGAFFKQLDDTIALQQQELDTLKQTKQGFLQKMFPKEDETVPEVRFPGFSGKWEEQKVENFSKATYGGGTPKTNIPEYWQGHIPWIQSSDLTTDKLFNLIPQKYISEKAVNSSATKLIPKNSIAIVTRVGVGKLVYMPFEYATSQDFLSLSELKINPLFSMYALHKLLKRELNNIQGTSIKGMTKADLLEKKLKIPVNIEEQSQIGSFFKQLDDTIALQQRELDAMKETKKAFLQKMFV